MLLKRFSRGLAICNILLSCEVELSLTQPEHASLLHAHIYTEVGVSWSNRVAGIEDYASRERVRSDQNHVRDTASPWSFLHTICVNDPVHGLCAAYTCHAVKGKHVISLLLDLSLAGMCDTVNVVGERRSIRPEGYAGELNAFGAQASFFKHTQ